MRTIILACALAWGWFFAHNQITGAVEHGTVAAIGWFGLDAGSYMRASSRGGVDGVLSQYSSDFQGEAKRAFGTAN